MDQSSAPLAAECRQCWPRPRRPGAALRIEVPAGCPLALEPQLVPRAGGARQAPGTHLAGCLSMSAAAGADTPLPSLREEPNGTLPPVGCAAASSGGGDLGTGNLVSSEPPGRAGEQAERGDMVGRFQAAAPLR